MINLRNSAVGRFEGMYSSNVVSVPERIMDLIFANKNGRPVNFRAAIEVDDYPLVRFYDLSSHPNSGGFNVNLSRSDNRLVIPRNIKRKLDLIDGESVSFCYIEGVLEVHRTTDMTAAKAQEDALWKGYVDNTL
jgi:hypothetical protein